MGDKTELGNPEAVFRELGKDFAIGYSGGRFVGTILTVATNLPTPDKGFPPLEALNNPVVEGASKAAGTIYATARAVAKTAQKVQQMSAEVIKQQDTILESHGMGLKRYPSLSVIEEKILSKPVGKNN